MADTLPGMPPAPPTYLERLRSVMELQPATPDDAPGAVTFASTDDDTGEPTKAVVLRRDDWDDMGRPETITVTVELGDRLHVPPVRWGDDDAFGGPAAR